MLGGVHKPDVANKEKRLLERRHAARNLSRLLGASPPLPSAVAPSAAALRCVFNPPRTTARRGLSPRPQRTRCACLRYMDRNYPLLAADCDKHLKCPVHSQSLTPVYLATSRRAQLCATTADHSTQGRGEEGAHATSSKDQERRVRAAKRVIPVLPANKVISGFLISLRAAYLSRSSSSSRTRTRTNANAPRHGHLGIQNVEGGGALCARSARRQRHTTPQADRSDDHPKIAVHRSARLASIRTGTALVKTSEKAARAYDACSLCGGAPGGRSGNRKPFSLVLKLHTRTRAHDTRAGVQDVDGVAIPRSARLIRMASANPVPPASEGHMRAYRHGRSFHIRSLVTSQRRKHVR
ncbi:hypothetical protein C8R45DRAFT_1110563 [Mycena sanguinolenta]|nr:hypothetical protein C8R45DRAFT_1110563 [Mycena sanguinolenta]